MAYPGNPELSPEAQERVMATFHQVVRNLQDGRRDEALIGLEFILRLDPMFAPAADLKRQLEAGGELDLASILGSLQAPSQEELEAALAEAVDLYDRRRFLEAKEAVERVLLELPGHPEARRLLGQIQEALKVEAQVGNYLAQAREALERGEPQEAANFVLMAQALDPHHPGISPMLAELEGAAAPPAPEEAPARGAEVTFEFEREPAGEPEPAPALGEGGGLELEPGGGGELSFEPEPEVGAPVGEDGAPEAAAGADVEELFTLPEEGEAAAPGEAAAEGPTGEEADKIAELLERGQRAFDAGDYQGAIDVWSRIYLVDPAAPGVGERIDAARARLEERAREAEILFAEATEAAEAGRREEALEVLARLLEAQPGHIEALALKERLERTSGAIPVPQGEGEGAEAAPPPPPPPAPPAEEGASPAIEEDLFREELPTELPLPELPEEAPAPAPTPARRRGLPWRLVALAAAALLVVAGAAWLGSRMFAGGGDEEAEQHAAVERALRHAEELYRQGRAEEAIHLLEQVPAGPLDQARIARRITRYRQALVPPTPTPPPEELVAAREAMDSGRWFRAFEIATRGLGRRPDDPGLRQVRAEALEIEPRLASWERALARRDFAAALAVARTLAERHPGDPDVAAALERALFDAGVAELRKYNLTGGEQLLAELARRRPEDAEVRRILEFIRTYKARPVDMQLKIFIGSIHER